MLRRGYFFVLAFLLFFAGAAPAVTTPRDLRAALQELADLRVKEGSGNPPSRDVLDQTVRLRHRLRDYGIGSVVDSARRASTLADALSRSQQRLREVEFPLLPAGKAAAEAIPEARAELFAVPGAPEWLGLKTTVSLACGGDHALYFLRLLATPDGAFEATLAFAKENPLESVADLTGVFAAVSALAPQGAQLRVATIESVGGCTSLWRPVKMRVFQTDEHPYRPLRLFEKERLAFLGEAPTPQASLSPDGFLFEYRTLYRLDAGRHSRKEIVRLVQEEQGVGRLPPLSDDPLAFIDEWVTTSWPEAQRWVTGSRLASVRKWHEELAGSGEPRLRTSVVGSGECPQTHEAWVHLKAGEDFDRMRSIYGLLRSGTDGYRVEQFVNDLPQGCRSGPTPARPQ